MRTNSSSMWMSERHSDKTSSMKASWMRDAGVKGHIVMCMGLTCGNPWLSILTSQRSFEWRRSVWLKQCLDHISFISGLIWILGSLESQHHCLHMQCVSIRRYLQTWKTAAYAMRFHTQTPSDLKGCRVCDAFPYADTFRLERLLRMWCIFICGYLHTWKAAGYAMHFHMQIPSHLKGCCVYNAFPYTDTFRLERLLRIQYISICEYHHTWKTVVYAMHFHMQIPSHLRDCHICNTVNEPWSTRCSLPLTHKLLHSCKVKLLTWQVDVLEIWNPIKYDYGQCSAIQNRLLNRFCIILKWKCCPGVSTCHCVYSNTSSDHLK